MVLYEQQRIPIMRLIDVRNVNQAWRQGIAILLTEGMPEKSRGGDVIVHPDPVTTCYRRPWERVLFCPIRDANPFFHLFESAWMLSGTSDARWLDRYVHDFSARYAEPSGYMYGAYGKRWRESFLLHPDNPKGATHDQLELIGGILRDDPCSRRAVLTMWDPFRDLGRSSHKDYPCNTQAYFRGVEHAGTGWTLHLTVCCRSNDIVWGCYGANAVHMSIMHEYVAALAGMRQGRYYQISNNWHGYQQVLDKMKPEMQRITREWSDAYSLLEAINMPLFNPEHVGEVREEVKEWMLAPSRYKSSGNQQLFDSLLTPMSFAHDCYKDGEWASALAACLLIRHPDWRLAAEQWINRRMDKSKRKEEIDG